mmetsp:Transcript_38980/g.68008  ORF Transcript_38980/g.68008 Transcript_38980/m.68008 type:complete len:279 (+) Transcript_38980:36-872(+)
MTLRRERNQHPWNALFICFILCVPLLTKAGPDSLRIELKAGEVQCFYEDNDSPGKLMEFKVFVLRGGELDVLASARGPLAKNPRDGLPIPAAGGAGGVIYEGVVSSIKMEDGDFAGEFNHQFMMREGTYEVCLRHDPKQLAGGGGEPRVVEFSLAEPGAAAVAAGAAASPENGLRAGVTEDERQTALQKAADKLGLGKKMEKYALALAKARERLAEVRAKQEAERHRLAVHSALNRSSHKKMVLSSVVETAVFVAVSLFQIFYIKRWFAGKGLQTLGR